MAGSVTAHTILDPGEIRISRQDISPVFLEPLWDQVGCFRYPDFTCLCTLQTFYGLIIMKRLITCRFQNLLINLYS